MRNIIMPRGAARLSFALLIWLAVGNCVTNPATGGKMFSLVSESQEIQMGQEYKVQVEAQMGLYDDPELQAFIDSMGQAMAAVAERPQLPWSFEIVDDPVVNAFALPGGPVFFTRGIMAYFSSEAEMAAVMGHEIGHITARHSVEQMSRQQLAQIGLVAGAMASDYVRRNIESLGQGLQVLFLSYGRDDEHQSDMLGVRYASRTDFDVRESVTMHQKLGRLTAMHGADAIPDWLSTHPSSEDRIERLRALTDTFPASYFQKAQLGRESYLRRIDGIVYGENPRNGYFAGNRFLHPDLRFELELPAGWTYANLPQSVLAQSPDDDALIVLSLSGTAGAEAAARVFFGQDGLSASDVRNTNINGLPATVGRFQATLENTSLAGRAAFIDHGGNTYRILAYTLSSEFGGYDGGFQATIRSFKELTDRRVLAVEPHRVELVRLESSMSVKDLYSRRPAPVDIAELAIINGVGQDESIPAGTLIKWVRGQKPPGAR